LRIAVKLASAQACRSGELPRGRILFTTYVRTAETGSYVALTRDLPEGKRSVRTLKARRNQILRRTQQR
jgi:hypothetical protein